MIKTPLMRAFAALLVLVIAVAADASIKVTAQLLDVEKGYVFFTTGDGFKLAPNAPMLDYKTGAAAKNSPGPRDWARATFDSTGTVTELEISRTALAPEGDLASVRRFAIALTPVVVNPELAPQAVDYASRPIRARGIRKRSASTASMRCIIGSRASSTRARGSGTCTRAVRSARKNGRRTVRRVRRVRCSSPTRTSGWSTTTCSCGRTPPSAGSSRNPKGFRRRTTRCRSRISRRRVRSRPSTRSVR